MNKETGGPALSEIEKAKLVVLQNAFGICSLSEAELYQTLEKIYWIGFKAGNEYEQNKS